MNSINKVGSILSKEDRKLRQGYVDLKKQTVEELMELIKRQNKLLQNRLFIEKLPDKGKKIISFRDELENEVKKRQTTFDSTCQLLSNLSLNDSKSEEIEWLEGKSIVPRQQLDSDDDDDDNDNDEYCSDSEIDPLKLIASHSGTHNGIPKKQSREPENKSSYVNKLCHKFDSVSQPKERFKPNQLKENNKNLFETSAENVKKRLGDKWEVTEATPPIFTIKNTQAIPLIESIKLQEEQAKKLREIEKKYTAEKLRLNMNIKMGDKLPVKNIETYRNVISSFDESANDEENEDQDEENESDN